MGNTRNLQARTWIIGNVRSKPPPSQTADKNVAVRTDSDSVLAMCMADGTILFIDPTAEEEMHRVLWCVQLRVRGELFGLSKVNLTVSFIVSFLEIKIRIRLFGVRRQSIFAFSAEIKFYC